MNLPKFGSSSSSKGSGAINILWIVLFGAFVVFGGLLIGTLAPHMLPIAGSTQAVQVDQLFQVMLVIGGAIFLLVEGLLLISAIHWRKRKGDNSDGPPIHGNTTIELIWTIIPAIIVIMLTVYAYTVWNNTRAAQPDEQQVGALGQRFAWTFSYEAGLDDLPPNVDVSTLPDAEMQASLTSGEKVVFQSPQLHTWVGQQVDVVMHTDDVNHAFWIPGMRIKQDLLAGLVTNIRFNPIEPGVYRIVCAELCGGGHGDMAGKVSSDGDLVGAWLIVHPDEETYLNEFYYPELMSVLYPPTDPVELGREVIQDFPCSGCHTLSALGWTGVTGPALDGVASRTQRLAATGNATMSDYIHQSIRNPSAYVVPGYNNVMLQFHPDPGQPNYMSDADLDAIVAYLLTQTQ
ncbi:MAG: cytochrome c oxidase subunit II [Anaerolineae bacterium]